MRAGLCLDAPLVGGGWELAGERLCNTCGCLEMTGVELAEVGQGRGACGYGVSFATTGSVMSF